MFIHRLALPKFAQYQPLVHLAAVVPLAWLVFDALTGNLTANPIQAIEQRTGKYALILLVASLAATPVNTITGWKPVLRWRRPLGLYAFLYAALHFLAFIGLDYGWNLGLLWVDVANKRFIFVGAAALVILIALALTSTKGWQRRLGKAWKQLHRWVYLAGGLVIVHYIWAVKTDIRGPLAWGAGVAVLLALRLPPAKRWLAAQRAKRPARDPVPHIEPKTGD
jgi:sulfoxide reductase heme-binding subunit YedZ